MKQYIGCDAHRRYSVFATVDEEGKSGPSIRVEHEPEQFRKYLRSLVPGKPGGGGSQRRMVLSYERAGSSRSGRALGKSTGSQAGNARPE
jgi:hypothetical protein